MRIGCTAFCNESNNSGAVLPSAVIAEVQVCRVGGPDSSTRSAFISATIRLRPWAAAVSSGPLPAVASAIVRMMPRVWSVSGRPAASTNSRSLARVVWNSWVGRVASCSMTSPERIGGPPAPSSTSCTVDTANALPGTMRAVTEAGMLSTYCGRRSICTMLSPPCSAGCTERTMPTNTPRYFTSDFIGSPSPTLASWATIGTRASSVPLDLANISAAATAHTARNAMHVRISERVDGPRPSSSN